MLPRTDIDKPTLKRTQQTRTYSTTTTTTTLNNRTRTRFVCNCFLVNCMYVGTYELLRNRQCQWPPVAFIYKCLYICHSYTMFAIRFCHPLSLRHDNDAVNGTLQCQHTSHAFTKCALFKNAVDWFARGCARRRSGKLLTSTEHTHHMRSTNSTHARTRIDTPATRQKPMRRRRPQTSTGDDDDDDAGDGGNSF